MELITHIYVAKLKPGTPSTQVDDWLDQIDRLSIAGMAGLQAGRDLGLREGNYDVAITADFEDADAWRRYNEDPLHNQIRAEHAMPIVEAQHRVQFEARRAHEPGTIRNVTLIDYRTETGGESADSATERLRHLEVPGMDWIDAGADLGLHPGNASIGVICDFVDAAGYHAYDADDTHNAIRRDIASHVIAARRVQIRPGS